MGLRVERMEEAMQILRKIAQNKPGDTQKRADLRRRCEWEEVSKTNRLHMNDNEAENWCKQETDDGRRTRSNIA